MNNIYVHFHNLKLLINLFSLSFVHPNQLEGARNVIIRTQYTSRNVSFDLIINKKYGTFSKVFCCHITCGLSSEITLFFLLFSLIRSFLAFFTLISYPSTLLKAFSYSSFFHFLSFQSTSSIKPLGKSNTNILIIDLSETGISDIGSRIKPKVVNLYDNEFSPIRL